MGVTLPFSPSTLASKIVFSKKLSSGVANGQNNSILVN